MRFQTNGSLSSIVDGRVVVLGRQTSLLVRSFTLLLSAAGVHACTVAQWRERRTIDDLVAALICDDTGTRQAIGIGAAARRRRQRDLSIVALDGVMVGYADVHLAPTADLDDLLRALHSAAPERRAGISLRSRSRAQVRAGEHGRLTDRENQVAALLIEGTSSARIADELGISVNTVRTHVQNIMSKLGVSSRVEIAGVVAQNRWMVDTGGVR